MAKEEEKKDNSISNILSARRTIPLSSYDLLEGTFKLATKARNAGIVILVLSFTVFSYITLTGLLTESKVRGINSKSESVKGEIFKVSSSLGVVEGHPELTPLQLINKKARVNKDLYSIAVAQPSSFQVLDNLRSTMVSGLSIRTIKFCSSEPNDQGDCGILSQKENVEKIVQVKYISIDFAVEDLATASQWVGNIKQMAWVSDVKYFVQGKNVKIYATLAPDIFPQESLSTMRTLGFTEQVNSTPPLPGGNN